MSGIVGMVHQDGSPVDEGLLWEMTKFLAFRGPDAVNVWTSGQVGFGHALLRTTDDSPNERQPCTLDGQVWITADARIDAQAELVEKLSSKLGRTPEPASDAELILHAYQAWGEECVAHLLGDFTFAIWDGTRRRLFCARDHLGVKQLFYVHKGNRLIFSNTLDCLRLHPLVSDKLNEQTVGDFLVLAFNCDPATTVFADIHRLPPAHVLICAGEATSAHRYWALPVSAPTQYRRDEEYVERFRVLLRTAVKDRLRTDRVGLFLSGGLDSSSIAATAHALLREQSASFDLRGYTVVYERLFPDDERRYAGLVADALGIPVEYLVADDYELFQGQERPELYVPEPVDNLLGALSRRLREQIAGHSRVAFDGQGGDEALRPSPRHFVDLLKGLRWGDFLYDAARLARSQRRIPPLGIRTALKRWLGRHPAVLPYPVWLNPQFAARLDLRSRWERFHREKTPLDAPRASAYEALAGPILPYVLQAADASFTGMPVEVRFPYLDLRLVAYLLSLPTSPWCVSKEVVRSALGGVLPEAVCRRPKTPLAGDVLLSRLRSLPAQRIDDIVPAPELADFVVRDAIPSLADWRSGGLEAWVNMRPFCINFWLQSRSNFRYKYAASSEDCNERARGSRNLEAV